MKRIESAAMLILGVVILYSGSCTPTAELRLKYTVEVSQCIANERHIVDREGTTEEADRADLTAERARCDAALAAIEKGQSQ